MPAPFLLWGTDKDTLPNLTSHHHYLNKWLSLLVWSRFIGFLVLVQETTTHPNKGDNDDGSRYHVRMAIEVWNIFVAALLVLVLLSNLLLKHGPHGWTTTWWWLLDHLPRPRRQRRRRVEQPPERTMEDRTFSFAPTRPCSMETDSLDLDMDSTSNNNNNNHHHFHSAISCGAYLSSIVKDSIRVILLRIRSNNYHSSPGQRVNEYVALRSEQWNSAPTPTAATLSTQRNSSPLTVSDQPPLSLSSSSLSSSDDFDTQCPLLGVSPFQNTMDRGLEETNQETNLQKNDGLLKVPSDDNKNGHHHHDHDAHDKDD